MTEAPLHRVLDVVEVLDEDSAGLIVTSVRSYGDGSYRYALASLDDSDDERAGLYDQGRLRPTGERADLARFAVPGALSHRDIVEVSLAHDDADVAGLTGEVDGWQEPHGATPLLISVWFAELGEVHLLPEDALTATGRRAAPILPDQPASSVFVSGDGELLGQVDYVVVDDIELHL